jgi:rubredoxin
MSSNYPEGSMRGSGIDAYEHTFGITCPECDYYYDEDLTVDDWGNVNADLVCPKCKADFNWFASMDDYEEA